MNLLTQFAFLKALGWALLHSLWQMGVLWLLYVLITADGRKFQSRQRYNIALILVITGAISFLFTVFNQFNQSGEPVVVYRQFAASSSPFISSPSLLSETVRFFEPALPLFSTVYLIAVGLLFIRFSRQYFFTRSLIASDLQKVNPGIRLFLQQMADRFTIKKKIRIGLSNLVTTPLTLGFWKPVILLPVAAINQLSIQQTEAIILHELNHIKQNDYLVNLIIACVDILLFFNPFSRLLTGILMKERENNCDDLVLQFRYSPADYAKALLILEQHRLHSAPLLAVAATGNNKKILLNRVQRILFGKTNSSTVNHKMFLFFLCAALVGSTGFFHPAKTKIIQFPSGNYSNTTNIALELMPVFSQPQTNKPNSYISRNASFYNPSNSPKQNIPTIGNFSGKEENLNTEVVEMAFRNVASEEVDPAALEASTLNGFVMAQLQREFSIRENQPLEPPMESFTETQPFVPANSFSYQYIEDTSLPKRYVPTIKELQEKENLEIALKALKEIDWQNVQKEITGNIKKLEIQQLQTALTKALTEANWKKINEEIGSGFNQAEQDLKTKQTYLLQLQKFHKVRVQQKQTDDQKRQLILMERVMQNKELQICEEEAKNAEKKITKKIVVI